MLSLSADEVSALARAGAIATARETAPDAA
jgi:hypothetical protein